MLRHRKIIEKLQPYIPGKPISEVKKELGLTHVIKLASNENPLGSSPKAIQAVKEWTENMAIYPDGNCTDLKDALASRLNLDTAQLLVGAGSDEIVELITQTYINPGDNAIMGCPSFPRYQTVTGIMDGDIIEIPLTQDYRLDLQAFLDNITKNTRIIWICNPNNPTGTIITHEEQKAFLEKVPSDILVVLDEAYYEYVQCDDYPESTQLLDEYDNIMILRTFSKVYGLAGLRVGYAISCKENINYLNRVRGPFNVNAAAQVAALAALYDRDFVQKSVKNNQEGKRYLCQCFDNMGIEYIPTYANFIMVKVNRNSKELFNQLLLKGIIIRSGDIYGMDDWIRLTVGTPEENRQFIAALKEML
jgi:histidinol-phosphate aminotransferase